MLDSKFFKVRVSTITDIVKWTLKSTSFICEFKFAIVGFERVLQV